MAQCWRVVVLALVAVMCACCSFAAVEEQGETDEICQLLFDEYVVPKAKGYRSEAAQELIADRGRMTGFWKPVLEELRKNDSRSALSCLDILGLMLQGDANARDYLKSGAMTAMVQRVCLPTGVVPELMTFAEKPDNNLLDHYIIALARARDERCKDFFTEILKGQEGRSHSKSEQFHAAVGLANLADPAGVEWLIQHCENANGSVYLAAPPARTTWSLEKSSTIALQSLASRTDISSKKGFEEWWATVSKPFVPGSLVNLKR